MATAAIFQVPALHSEGRHEKEEVQVLGAAAAAAAGPSSSKL